MQSISSISEQSKTMEAKLDKITIQNKLQDIIDIINEFQCESEYSIGKKKNYKKGSVNENQELNLLVQTIIQKQIKNYIDKLESCLKKYWYNDIENKLYIFLTDLKHNWNFFQAFFQVDESVDFLEDSVHHYVLELKKQRAILEIDELLDAIANTFDYWPTQKAQKCLELANFLEQKDKIQHTLNKIQETNILHSIENTTDLMLLSNLPKVFPLFQDKDHNHKYNKLLQKKMYIETQNKNFDDINNTLVQLEETIIRGKYWDESLEKEIVLKLSVIEKEKLKDTIKMIIKLLQLYYSEQIKNNSILDLYPEIQNTSLTVHIHLDYEGTWTLNVFFKGKWIPAYRLKESSAFSNLVFNQEGEWKNRKFKCFSWTLEGNIPVGTILKLTNKKEGQYLIVTKTSNHIRDINLSSIDENLILNLFMDESNAKIATNKPTKEDYFFLSEFVLEKAFNLKLVLKLLSVDKKKISILSKLFSNMLIEIKSGARKLLNNDTDKKFLLFLDKLIQN